MDPNHTKRRLILIQSQTLAPHETLEVHELLGATATSFQMCTALKGMVTDPQLTSIIQQQAQTCETHMRDLQQLLQRSAFTL